MPDSPNAEYTRTCIPADELSFAYFYDPGREKKGNNYGESKKKRSNYDWHDGKNTLDLIQLLSVKNKILNISLRQYMRAPARR